MDSLPSESLYSYNRFDQVMNTVALPIENKVRELDGKLWLGLNLVERGYDVVLGPSWEIKPTIDITQPDVYFTKDPGDGNIPFIKQLQQSNIRVCGISPEAALNSKTEYHAQNKQDVIDTMDAYFAWGPEPAKEIKKQYDNIEAKVHITGNPRFDPLIGDLRSVYAASGEDIREKYGDFILINTNFAIGNSIDREQMFEVVQRNTPERDLIQEERLSLRLLYSFLELVLYLIAEDIDHNIILRPHPGEDHSTYRELFDRYETVHVKHEGDVRPWIHAADGVIHHDCTTGVESALMSKPVVSYQPLSDTTTDTVLSQVVSQSETTRDGIKDWIIDSAQDDGEHQLTQHQKTELRRYFPNIDELAAPKICDVVDSLLVGSHGFTSYNIDIQQKIERRIKASPFGTSVLDSYDYGRDILTGSDYRRSREKTRQKFSGLDHTELSKRIEEIRPHLSISNVTIKAVPLMRHTYRIVTDR